MPNVVFIAWEEHMRFLLNTTFVVAGKRNVVLKDEE